MVKFSLVKYLTFIQPLLPQITETTSLHFSPSGANLDTTFNYSHLLSIIPPYGLKSAILSFK